VLAEEGPPGLRIDRLAARLGVTRASALSVQRSALSAQRRKRDEPGRRQRLSYLRDFGALGGSAATSSKARATHAAMRSGSFAHAAGADT
jgi:hypothetical protein